MPGTTRFLVGGLGALAPTVVSLLVVDLEPVLSKLTALAVVGLGVKVLVLFLIGGLWAWLHKTESVHLRVFEIGIVAPATILTFQNGVKVGNELAGRSAGAAILSLIAPEALAQTAAPAMSVPALSTVTGRVVAAESGEPVVGAHIHVDGMDVGAMSGNDGTFSLHLPVGEHTLRVTRLGTQQVTQRVRVAVGVASQVDIQLSQAATLPTAVQVQGPLDQIEAPREPGMSQFLRGLLGKPNPRAWFVTGGRYAIAEGAIAEAQEYIAALGDTSAARIYFQPDPSDPSQRQYVVVFGTYLPLDDASALQKKLAAIGVTNASAVSIRRP
jgi:hypothetical protein